MKGRALRAVPERWAFLAGSSFEKAAKRHGEPRGRLCQQEGHRPAVTAVGTDCS